MAFYIGVYAYAIIVHTRANQLLPQLSIEHLILFLYNVDTLNICMKEFGSEKIIFEKNDSYENIDNFSLIRLLFCFKVVLLLWIFYVFFCLVFAMPLYASVYMCLVVTCWERADLLALVCGVLL